MGALDLITESSETEARKKKMTPELSKAPGRVSNLVLPVILLAVFVMPMGISGTAVALPRIADDLGSSPTLLQWVINGFNAAFAIFTLFWGCCPIESATKPPSSSGPA